MTEDVKVPEGWKRVRLGEVLKYEQPTKYLVKNENYDKNSGIPVLTPGKTFILGYTEEKFGIFENLPVIIFDDFTTESKYINFPFKLKSSAIKILNTKNEESNLYVAYYILQILNFKPGSEHKRFWISEFSKFQISLPPLPEQQKIAEILETVDRAIEKTDKIIEKYKRIKQGLMQDLLTKGIDENGQIRSPKTHRFKNSPLGKIPEEWEVVRLGKLANIKTGNSNVEDAIDDGLYPLFDRSLEVKCSNKYLFDTEAVIIPGEGSDFYPKYYHGKFDLHQRAYAIFNFRNLDGKFLFYVMHLVNKQLIQNSVGTTVISLRLPNFQNLIIPLPPLPEQKRIASILSQIDTTIEKEEAYKQKLERIKKGLMDDLLTGRVRVNKLIKEKEVEYE